MQTVYEYIIAEQTNYQTTPIQLSDGFEWNMFNHIRTALLFKNSKFTEGANDYSRPFKNIVRPLLNLQYRSEGFDVKDIVLFVNDSYEFFKSFLAKKFHDKWAREAELDTFIDELVESYIDFGGTLIKNHNTARPEVVPMQRIAFCDQTDMLSGPLCERHYLSPDELRDMAEKGWENVEEVIQLAGFYTKQGKSDRPNKTPGKYVEIYELHGILPSAWLGDQAMNVDADSIEYESQMQIVTFYRDKNDNDHGITLYAGKEKKSVYDVIKRDPIYGRALGLGSVEELFEAQVWTNYDMIRMKDMLDSASKVIYQTADAAFANRNRITDLDNGEILVTAPNTNLVQINTSPMNLALFERSVAEWDSEAQAMAGSSDALLGRNLKSGVPFRLAALMAQQSQALHDYRRGKIAIFMDRIYRNWIMPHIVKEISKGGEFFSDLSADEMLEVVDGIVTCETNKLIVNKILQGQIIEPTEIDAYKQQVRTSFMKDNRKFIQILADEMKDLPLDVRVDIAGKQKDLAGMVDKLSNIFKTVIAAPQVLQDPAMAKLFNMILEYSGLDPIDFTGYKPPTGMAPPGQNQQSQQQLPQNVAQPVTQ